MESGTGKPDSDSLSVQSLCIHCLEKERIERTGSTSHLDNTKPEQIHIPKDAQNNGDEDESPRTSDTNSNSKSAENSDSSGESFSSSWNDLFTLGDLFVEEDDTASQRDASRDGNSTAAQTDASDRLSIDLAAEHDFATDREVIRLARRLALSRPGSEIEEDVDGVPGGAGAFHHPLWPEFGEEEEDLSAAAGQIVPLYPMGRLEYTECAVCCEQVDLYLRACCDCPVCDSCMLSFITIQVEEARVRVGCPNDACDKFVHRDEIIVRLSGPTKDKFFRFLVDANKEINVKTCPKCSSVMTVDKDKVTKPDKMGVPVVCEDCALEWCFVCQAPFHEKLSCKQFRRGDKLLQKWAKENHFGQANAQKCPKCKAFISRTSGCDHMTCSQCRTEFCYRCGGRFLSFRFLGDHYNRLSIFGCKYRLMPERPHMRKFIRGSLFAGKMALVPVVAGVAVGVCAVFAAAGVVILPVIGGMRIHKWRKKKKAQKAAAEARREWRAKLAELRGRGDPYLERYRVMQLGNMDLSLHWYNHATSADSSDSLPETSSSAEPRETEHVASVHKSGSPISSQDSTASNWDSSEEFPEVDSLHLGQGAEPDTKAGQGEELGQKSGQSVMGEVKSGQEAEPAKLGQGTDSIKSGQDSKVGQDAESVKVGQGAESEEVPLAEEEDTVDFRETDDRSESEKCDVLNLQEASVENTQDDVIREITIEVKPSTVSNTRDEPLQDTKISREDTKRVKEEKKTKVSPSSSSSPSPPLLITPLDKDDVIHVQKPSKKTSDDSYKVKSIVSQYSCLGGKSREEDDDIGSIMVSDESNSGGSGGGGKKTTTMTTSSTGTTATTVVGKLMIRSASYDVAIREAGENNGVSVRQMVKRYSQGTSS